MPQTIIENPVINSPFAEPEQHFRFADEGITNEIVTSRRTKFVLRPDCAPSSQTTLSCLTLGDCPTAYLYFGCDFR